MALCPLEPYNELAPAEVVDDLVLLVLNVLQSVSDAQPLLKTFCHNLAKPCGDRSSVVRRK